MRSFLPRSGLLVLVLVLSHGSFTVTARKDRNQPHPHKGILKPYVPGPFVGISLSKSDEQKLANGLPVMKQSLPDKNSKETAGGAICVQHVDAPKDIVWNQILDLNSYTKKVSKVIVSKNYVDSRKMDGTRNMKTKMVLGVMPGYSLEAYYDHVYDARRDSMTWRLDYDKTSDFDDVSGHWHLETIRDKAGGTDKTRVYYAADVKMKGAVPTPVMNYIGKAALKQATGWVKRESEKIAASRKDTTKTTASIATASTATSLKSSTCRWGKFWGSSC